MLKDKHDDKRRCGYVLENTAETVEKVQILSFIEIYI